MTTAFLYDFISRNKFAVVSTLSGDNLPEAALIGFAATTNLQIIFDTSSNSRKYLNIIQNPSVALVIGWDNEQTVQYEGIAKKPTARELEELLPFYFNIFPDGKDRRGNMKDISYICVEPKWIRYSDYHKFQIEEMNF